MGTWFLFSAMGNYIAGWISALTGSSTAGAANSIDVVATISVYHTIGLMSIGIGVGLLLLTPTLRKAMHGVH